MNRLSMKVKQFKLVSTVPYDPTNSSSLGRTQQNVSTLMMISCNNSQQSSPATEALERSLKRRRISSTASDFINNIGTTGTSTSRRNSSTLIGQGSVDAPSLCSLASSLCTPSAIVGVNSRTKLGKKNALSNTSSLRFSFDDAYNAINAIDDENFDDFPKIAWDFDDA